MSNTSARARLRAEQESQRKKERRILALVAAGIVLVIVAAGIGFQVWRTNQRPSAGPTPTAGPTPITLTNGQPVVFGSTSAPVQLSLFEDFHCPHCADFEKAYQPVLDQALSSGKASISFYPLAFVDQGSAAAANGFGCAAQSGYGQSFFRGLFANTQLDWSNEQLITLFTQVSGAEAPVAFRSCVEQRQAEPWAQSIAAVADQRGVKSTPTMFIGTELVDISTLTPEALTAKIDEAAKS